MSNDTVVTVIAVAAVVLVAALIAMAFSRQRRSARLKDTFGPEYDRTVEETGKRRQAERDLAARRDEHAKLELRDLTPAARERYAAEWTDVQARFVDEPVVALTLADSLVTRLMGERGYPTDDFETRERLLSVEHNRVLDGYRSAHQVELSSRSNEATTETIRRAMLDFRQVFENLMGDTDRDADVYPAESAPRDRDDVPEQPPAR